MAKPTKQKKRKKSKKKRRSSLRYIILLGLVLAVGVILFALKSVFLRKEIRHVLLVSIDTWRADYVSCYGYPQKITPNIDDIAEQAVLFENVITPIPLTLPAHSSMLTGTIPPYHKVHDNLNESLGESNITLAEILKENGFTTGAIISAVVLNSRFGIDQGFDTYNDEFENPIKVTAITERRADEASRFALEWLDKHKSEKFFLFLHYYDPHHPYDPPGAFKSTYQYNPYAGEVAYTDYCLGQVINKLKELKLYNSTLIIITGDHGEMLGEHGESSHGYFIYQSAIKVPLIFKLPGRTKPQRINHIVGLIDIVPTICSMLGIEMQEHIQGVDLSEYIKTGKPKVQDRHIFCESLTATKYNGNSLLSVVTDRWKYIQTTKPELYDLANDAEESNNMLAEEPQRGRILQDRLQQILEESVRSGEADSNIELDEQTLESLKSLGYVGGSVDADFTFDQSKDDPKDLLDFHNSIAKVQNLIFKGDYDQAKSLCEELISQRPGVAQAQYNMARIFMKQEDYTSAIPYLQEVIKLKPDDFHARKDLADAFELEGKHQEAVNLYLQALQLKPNHAQAHYNLGMALKSQDKIDQAISHFRQALQSEPNYVKAHNNLGSALAEQGKLDEAITHFTEALRIKPDFANAHKNMGITLLQQGELDEAIIHFSEAVQLDPNSAEVHYILARALTGDGKTSEAIIHLKETLRLKPDWVSPMNGLAWLLATHKEDKIRDPTEAVRLAEKACQLTNYEDPALVDTLAAAYASDGNFSDAIATAEKALKLAVSTDSKAWAEEIQNRLQLYKRGQPYFEPPQSQEKHNP